MKKAPLYFIDEETKRETEVQILKCEYQPTSSAYLQLNKYLNSKSATSDIQVEKYWLKQTSSVLVGFKYIQKEMFSDLHGYVQTHEALAVFVSGLCSAALHILPVAFS